ncbi:MAG: methyltransferase [Lachnospiraceae bacterium]|nr:methyltransferase [Lachnospiraceae bacterium]
MRIVLEDGISFDAERLKTEPWMSYLYYTEHHAVNMERVEVVEQVSGRETLSYVLRTLAILSLDAKAGKVTPGEAELVKLVLEWSEVSKGGTVKEREDWRAKGYALDIHNLASAEIFLEDWDAQDEEKMASVLASTELPGGQVAQVNRDLVALLIRTHGLIGQALRGEVAVKENEPLLEVKRVLGEEAALRVLSVLNHSIIGGVSLDLWQKVSAEAESLLRRILSGDLSEFTTRERMTRLDERLAKADEGLAALFEKEIFPKYELWYYQAAFADFGISQVEWLLRKMLEKTPEGVTYLSFKPLSDGLYYDYQGKKHLNIYKERIIEKYIRDNSTSNVELVTMCVGRAMLVDFRFTPVCEKLIDFCVEAERSGLLTFEKSITVLYDMFGFRRDAFDRLNNEEKYLATMNASEESTKNSIIAYVTGQTVVDVGSGGGVLLDLLEKEYPEKTIIGTDISDNVLQVLDKKKAEEGHAWTVRRHNFCEETFPEKVDAILFSSILHEVFSYTETENGRFDVASVERALQNAYDSLNPGGRIIIRDGVKSPVDGSTTIEIMFKDPEGIEFFENYVRDFEGLKDIEDKKIEIDKAAGKVRADANFAREFLYTYTWGKQSYAHEVQEQFGYFTIEEFRKFFERLGAKVLRCESFLEPGYVTHLAPKVSLSPDRFPDSNCIVVVEKSKNQG